jgi:hypothetical protein
MRTDLAAFVKLFGDAPLPDLDPEGDQVWQRREARTLYAGKKLRDLTTDDGMKILGYLEEMPQSLMFRLLPAIVYTMLKGIEDEIAQDKLQHLSVSLVGPIHDEVHDALEDFTVEQRDALMLGVRDLIAANAYSDNASTTLEPLACLLRLIWDARW